MKMYMYVDIKEALLRDKEEHGEVCIEVPVNSISYNMKRALVSYMDGLVVANKVYLNSDGEVEYTHVGSLANNPLTGVIGEASIANLLNQLGDVTAHAVDERKKWNMLVEEKRAEQKRVQRMSKDLLQIITEMGVEELATQQDKFGNSWVDRNGWITGEYRYNQNLICRGDRLKNFTSKHFQPLPEDGKQLIYDASVLVQERKLEVKRAHEKAKTDQLTAVVKQFGNRMQQERWEEGFMPVIEAVNLLIDSEIERIGDIVCEGCESIRITAHNYDLDKSDHLHGIIECPCSGEYELKDTHVLNKLSDDQYTIFSHVQATIKIECSRSVNMNIMPYLNTYKCDNCGKIHSLLVVSITYTVGEFTIRLEAYQPSVVEES